MKSKNLLLLGFLIGVAVMLVNRYVYTMPTWLYVGGYAIAILLLLVSISDNIGGRKR